MSVPGDIKLPPRVQEAMQMQVEAERKKRAAILESEGIREAEINVAEGKKRAKILASGNKFYKQSFTGKYAPIILDLMCNRGRTAREN